MQDFQCIYIKNKYGDKAETFITDTDNLMCKTETKNAYEDLFTKKELFDFSNYPKVSKYYNGANNSVAGNIKDEINSMPIKDFAELKSKNVRSDISESKKPKVISKNGVDDEVKYEG